MSEVTCFYPDEQHWPAAGQPDGRCGHQVCVTLYLAIQVRKLAIALVGPAIDTVAERGGTT